MIKQLGEFVIGICYCGRKVTTKLGHVWLSFPIKFTVEGVIESLLCTLKKCETWRFLVKISAT